MRHAAPVDPASLTLAARLQEVTEELEDIAESADDLGWMGVRHKVEAALGDLASALTAAKQYETEDR